jgi:hypothetical protein
MGTLPDLSSAGLTHGDISIRVQFFCVVLAKKFKAAFKEADMCRAYVLILKTEGLYEPTE